MKNFIFILLLLPTLAFAKSWNCVYEVEDHRIAVSIMDYAMPGVMIAETVNGENLQPLMMSARKTARPNFVLFSNSTFTLDINLKKKTGTLDCNGQQFSTNCK